MPDRAAGDPDAANSKSGLESELTAACQRQPVAEPDPQLRADGVPALGPGILAWICTGPAVLPAASRRSVRTELSWGRAFLPPARLRVRAWFRGLHRLPGCDFRRGSSQRGDRALTEPRRRVADAARTGRVHRVVGDDL